MERYNAAVQRKPLVAAALSLALLVLALSFREDPSPDTWFHLAAGRRIVSEHHIPRTNEFLEFHQGYPYVDHEWLFQVATWIGYSLGGEPLLTVLKALVVLAAFAALASALRPAGWTGALVALLPAILVSEARFLLRPEVVSLAATAAVIAILERDRLAPSRSNIIILALVQLVWSNCHGFALMGPGVTFAYLVAQAVGRALGSRASRLGLETTDTRPGRVALLLGLQLAVSFLNPNFHEGALYPVLVLLRAGGDWGTGGVYMRIVELQSPFSAGLATTFPVVFLELSIVAALLGFALSVAEKRARLEHAALALLLLGSASSYLRNLPFAALGLALPTAHGLAALGRRLGTSRERARLAALVATTVLALVAARASLSDQLDANAQYVARAGLRFSDFLRYDEAVAFLDSSPPKGKLFNNFGAGHFLIFARDRKPPLPYICGNTELYPRKFLVDYHDVVSGREPYGPAFARDGITDALLDHRVEVSRELIARLQEDPGWRLVHADSHCVLYRKVDETTPPPVDLALLAKSFPFVDTTRDDFALTRALRAVHLLPPREPVPLEKLHVACLLDTLGRSEDALALARAARDERPDYPPALYIVASLEWRTDAVAGEKDALVFARLYPTSPYGFAIAGQAALRQGDPRRAAHHFEKALEIAPSMELAQEMVLAAYIAEKPPDTVSLRRALAGSAVRDDLRAFYEGQAFAVDGRLDEAEKRYRDAIAIRSSFTQAHYELARVLHNRHAFPEARDEFEKVVRAWPRDGQAWLDLGIARRDAGDVPGAKDALALAKLLRPRDPAPLVALGYLALDEHDRDGALRYAQEALGRDPRSVQAKGLFSRAQEP